MRPPQVTWFKNILIALSLFSTGLFAQQPPRINVHDPALIKQGDTFYLFATGTGIARWSSKDLKNWVRMAPVFSEPPSWMAKAVPGFKGHFWAPDIRFFKGKYYLYYSVSTFGKNTSAIGLVINSTLNPTDSAYKWVDYGSIIRSSPGKEDWNAIDPNLITDKDGMPSLAFGSFWGGLKLVSLTADGKQVDPGEAVITLASRRASKKVVGRYPAIAPDSLHNAIEAPFIYRKGKFYYLFASADYCCKGPKSTYKMIVGRSKNIRGPFLDRNRVSMAKSGGTILLEGDVNWYGVGHNAVYPSDGKDYLVFHGYDAADQGKAKLRIEQLEWKNGWPYVPSP